MSNRRLKLPDSHENWPKTNRSMCALCYRRRSAHRIMHRFPSNPILSEKWAKACDRPWITKATPEERKAKFMLCMDHFRHFDYEFCQLHKGAVPSRIPPKPEPFVLLDRRDKQLLSDGQVLRIETPTPKEVNASPDCGKSFALQLKEKLRLALQGHGTANKEKENTAVDKGEKTHFEVSSSQATSISVSDTNVQSCPETSNCQSQACSNSSNNFEEAFSSADQKKMSSIDSISNCTVRTNSSAVSVTVTQSQGHQAHAIQTAIAASTSGDQVRTPSCVSVSNCTVTNRPATVSASSSQSQPCLTLNSAQIKTAPSTRKKFSVSSSASYDETRISSSDSISNSAVINSPHSSVSVLASHPQTHPASRNLQTQTASSPRRKQVKFTPSTLGNPTRPSFSDSVSSCAFTNNPATVSVSASQSQAHPALTNAQIQTAPSSSRKKFIFSTSTLGDQTKTSSHSISNSTVENGHATVSDLACHSVAYSASKTAQTQTASSSICKKFPVTSSTSGDKTTTSTSDLISKCAIINHHENVSTSTGQSLTNTALTSTQMKTAPSSECSQFKVTSSTSGDQTRISSSVSISNCAGRDDPAAISVSASQSQAHFTPTIAKIETVHPSTFKQFSITSSASASQSEAHLTSSKTPVQTLPLSPENEFKVPYPVARSVRRPCPTSSNKQIPGVPSKQLQINPTIKFFDMESKGETREFLAHPLSSNRYYEAYSVVSSSPLQTFGRKISAQPVAVVKDRDHSTVYSSVKQIQTELPPSDHKLQPSPAAPVGHVQVNQTNSVKDA